MTQKKYLLNRVNEAKIISNLFGFSYWIIILCGIISAVIQKWNNKFVKYSTIALDILIASLTTFCDNATDIGYKEICNRMKVVEYESYIVMNKAQKDTVTEADINKFKETIDRLLLEIYIPDIFFNLFSNNAYAQTITLPSDEQKELQKMLKDFFKNKDDHVFKENFEKYLQEKQLDEQKNTKWEGGG